jgi:hypothetical protein
MQRLKCIKKEDNPEGITLLLPTSQKLYQKGEKNKTKKVEMGGNIQDKSGPLCPVAP